MKNQVTRHFKTMTKFYIKRSLFSPKQVSYSTHIHSSVYVTAFCLKLRVRSQGMIMLDLNVWKTFEMLCLSKTWPQVVLIHSGRVN